MSCNSDSSPNLPMRPGEPGDGLLGLGAIIGLIVCGLLFTVLFVGNVDGPERLIIVIVGYFVAVPIFMLLGGWILLHLWARITGQELGDAQPQPTVPEELRLGRLPDFIGETTSKPAQAESAKKDGQRTRKRRNKATDESFLAAIDRQKQMRSAARRRTGKPGKKR